MFKSKNPCLPAGRKNQSRTFSILAKVLSFKGAGCIVVLIFVFYILNFLGCATVKEAAKGIAGISTQALEDGRKNAIRKTFDCDYATCYSKTREMLGRIGTYIYAQDQKKKMIAIYVSEEDTTPVGIFFKEINVTHTQIEVSSPSTYAKEFISAKIFLALDRELNPEKEKDKSDAQEETVDRK